MASRMALSLVRHRVCPWAVTPDAARGYLAGEQDPDEDAGVGLLTVNAVPSGRWVEVWHRQSLTLVAMVFSDADGAWQVPDLPGLDTYRLIATDYAGVYESQIVDDVLPYVPA